MYIFRLFLLVITFCDISRSTPLIPLYQTHPTLPHLSCSTPLIPIYRTNPTLPHSSNSTPFIPLYFAHPTLPPYPTFPNLSNSSSLRLVLPNLTLFIQLYPTNPHPSNSTPHIHLYPTHPTLPHLSKLPSITQFYPTRSTQPHPSHFTPPIPLYIIQYKNADKKYKREQNKTTIVNSIESI